MKEAGIIVLQDGGGGITQKSIKYYNRVKGKFHSIMDIFIQFNREFAFEASGLDSHGNLVILLLSGCNCGYGGTGPNGSVEIIEDICKSNLIQYDVTELRHAIFSNDAVHLSLRDYCLVKEDR